MLARSPKTFLLSLLSLAALAVGCGSEPIPPTSSWNDWSDGNFTIQLPREPKLEPQRFDTEIGRIEGRLATIEYGRNRVFQLNQTTYPVAPEDYDVVLGLQGAVDGMLANGAGELESSSDIEHAGLQCKLSVA